MFLKGSLLIFALFFVFAEGHFLFGKTQTRVEPCTQEGYMCDDCKTLVYCFQRDGVWVKEIADYCEAGMSCKAGNPAECTSAQNDQCDDNIIKFDFKCHQVGIFPHPFDCKKYYICVDDAGVLVEEPLHLECKNGYGYDPRTSLCKKPLASGRCPKRPVEPCTGSGRSSPIEGNPYLYAVCLTGTMNGRAVFFPNVFHCSSDNIFSNNSCVKPQSGVDTNSKCNATGNYYDYTDCKKYKECTAIGRDPVSKSCGVYTEQLKSPAARFERLIAREKPCVQDGLMCDDCFNLVMCVELTPGVFNKYPAEYCDGGKTCSSVTNSCTTQHDSECDSGVNQYEFICHQVGVFPHPFDCKKYFICISEGEVLYPTPLKYECVNDFGYDVKSRLCRKTLINGNCPKRLVDPCTGSGRPTAIEGSRQLYSICLVQTKNSRAVYFPQLFYCNDDALFMGTSCVKPLTGLNAEGKCSAVGNYRDPIDCKKYIECPGVGRDPISKSCAAGYEFHPINRACAQFSFCRT